MKKYLKIVVVCLLVCSSVCFFACTKKTAEEVEYEITDEGTVTITSYTDSTTRTEITVPNEIDGYPVTKIADYSLFNTESLQVIHIGKNVREIGTWALTNGKEIKEYTVSDENPYFTAVDGVLFTKDMKTLVAYPTAKNITFDKYGQTEDTTTYTVPEGVERIEARAFYRCVYLTKITFPSSVKEIGNMAFHRCTAVSEFSLGDGLETVGRDAFTYCTTLTEITFPKTIQKVDEYAFSYCENMKKVTFLCPKSQVTLGEKWYPTRDGQDIKDLSIVFAD